MKFILLIHGNEQVLAANTKVDDTGLNPEYAAYNEAMMKAGIILGGERLRPTSTAASVRMKDGRTEVLEGPYADPRAARRLLHDRRRRQGRGSEMGCSLPRRSVRNDRSASDLADCADLAIVDKRRPRAGVSEVMNIIGDVAGHDCIMVDDIVDSGGTLVNAAEAILKAGATSVAAYITHGVLSPGASERVAASQLKELVITDSIEASPEVAATKNIRTMSIAPLIGEAIARTAAEQSVSSLFD